MSDIVERLNKTPLYESWGEQSDLPEEAADEITRLRADNERLRVENIQMQAALGYGILAEDERHIIPSNPYKCGTCDAARAARAENERLRAVLKERTQVQANNIAFLDAENDRLRAALEPFSALADRYDPAEEDDSHAVWDQTALPTLGDLRRARAALAAQPKENSYD